MIMEQSIPLMIGQGNKEINSLLTLGMLALQNGLGISLSDYGNFLDVVVGDLKVATQAIQDAFILAAKAVSVPFQEG